MGAGNQFPWNASQWNQSQSNPLQADSCVVTLSDIQSRILARLDNNSLLYTNPELTSFANEAVRIANIHSGYLQGSFTTTSVANRPWYDNPSGTLYPLRVQFDSFYLQPSGLNKIGQRRPNWETETDASTGIPVSEWIKCGLKRFAIWPIDSIGGTTITLTSVLEPTLLVNSSDALQLPGKEFSDLIVDIGVHIATLKEGGKVFSDSMAIFDTAVSKLKKLRKFQIDRQPYYDVEVAHMDLR